MSITRAEHEGDDAADAEGAERGRNTSATMKRDAEQHQREAGVVDRQQLQRVEREQQAIAPTTPGSDEARVR